MRMVTVRRWGIILLLSLGVLNGSARAGGPIVFNEADGHPFAWRDNRAVYVVETGNLGVIPNAQVADLVARAFRRWTDVPTANLRVDNLDGIVPADVLAPFKRDITVGDFARVDCTVPGLGPTFTTERLTCALFTACLAQGGVNCPSPIVLDEDGSITEATFGPDSSVLGFSGPILFFGPPDFEIIQAFSVLNGGFFAGDRLGDDPTGTRFLEALMVHEFGHFLGLSHSDVNGDTAGFNPTVTVVGSTGIPDRALAPVDGLAAVNVDVTETMYPVLLTQGGVSPLNTPELDDQVALSTLYPRADTLAATGTITGNVFIPCTAQEATTLACAAAGIGLPDGRRAKRAQGVLVVARRIDGAIVDRDGDGFVDPPVLKDAVSQLTGATFAPLRCSGPVFRDGEGDGNPDNNGDGFLDTNNPLFFDAVLGTCSSPDQAGFLECATAINNNFGGVFFLGQCGVVNGGFSDPRPIGDVDEGHFTLAGLPAGQYIVQAVQTLTGSFSSPVRSSFLSDPSPSIQSDDNQTFTFFPNPQPGEFYNGLSGGCSDGTSACGNETASTGDNPFTYTSIAVAAGGQVNNINIFLNTSTARADFFGSPGFDYCALSDVNRDNMVNQKDIRAVVKAKAKLDKKKAKKRRIKNPRTDVNQDGALTFADIDIITDLVTNPNAIFAATTPADLRRGLAPFQAICAAAGQGGCAIEAPVENRQANGTPTDAICQTARDFGCTVQGCPR